MIYELIDRFSSREQEQPRALSVQQLCELGQVPRSSYYRHSTGDQDDGLPKQTDPLCEELHRISSEFPCYGYRRVTHELARRGHLCNHKRTLALMRREKLLCRRRKKHFIGGTTDSRHGWAVYPNLVPTLARGLTQINQLWVADLTYIHLLRGIAYLAVLLDAFSRRAIGWAVSSHIDTDLSLQALRMALRTRGGEGGGIVPTGLIHHSDRGVQYACHEYVRLLAANNITISMSRKGNPYDNALAESFMKTLKAEEVYLNEYEDLCEAERNIEEFIEQVYNKKRLHSSLGYKPPVEFEADYHKSLDPNNRSTLMSSNSVSL